jgi:hypothetical protein
MSSSVAASGRLRRGPFRVLRFGLLLGAFGGSLWLTQAPGHDNVAWAANGPCPDFFVLTAAVVDPSADKNDNGLICVRSQSGPTAPKIITTVDDKIG